MATKLREECDHGHLKRQCAVCDLEAECAELRAELAKQKEKCDGVATWLCDWDEDIEPGDIVALAKHVKEVCKDRGHRITELKADLREGLNSLYMADRLLDLPERCWLPEDYDERGKIKEILDKLRKKY